MQAIVIVFPILYHRCFNVRHTVVILHTLSTSIDSNFDTLYTNWCVESDHGFGRVNLHIVKNEAYLKRDK